MRGPGTRPPPPYAPPGVYPLPSLCILFKSAALPVLSCSFPAAIADPGHGPANTAPWQVTEPVFESSWSRDLLDLFCDRGGLGLRACLHCSVARRSTSSADLNQWWSHLPGF